MVFQKQKCSMEVLIYLPVLIKLLMMKSPLRTIFCIFDVDACQQIALPQDVFLYFAVNLIIELILYHLDVDSEYYSSSTIILIFFNL